MPKATVTVRELKNKDTGIDLSVTSYREIPGLVRSTFEYQIVVVSSLSCFKLPSHKESDVVQFTLFKKFPEFEDLRVKLNEAFSGTAFPPLVKKSLIVNEAVIKERRNNLDTFVKFLSATPRVITCSHVLTFLGVDAAKAKRFASGETDTSTQEDDGNKGEKEEEPKQDGMTSSNLFEEDEEEEGEDFLTAMPSARAAVREEDDFFSSSDAQSSSTDTRLFESQDLKRELTEDDEKDFAFVPDAIITKREKIFDSAEEGENELLQVDENIDLDKLLTLDTSPKQKQPTPAARQAHPEENAQSQVSKPPTPQKPSVPVKPRPAAKPLPVSAKPVVPSKPRPPSSDMMFSIPVDKPVASVRPIPAPRKAKPARAEEHKAEGDGVGLGGAVAGAGKSDMTSDDIMQYIAANTEDQDADLDLFS